MTRLYVALALCFVASGAFGVACPSPTVAVSGVDDTTFVARDTTGRCPPGYGVYEAPSHLTAYFSGALLSNSVTLCGADEYMSNGTCTPYTQGRCDTDYIEAIPNSSTFVAPDATNRCAAGYSLISSPAWMYMISTGMILTSAPTLCGAGQYMNNGVCTDFDTTQCPLNWYNYAPAGGETFVPTAGGVCGTNYVLTDDSVECDNRGDSDFCATFCASGEQVTWNGLCVPLCRAGVTELHIGQFVFPIYAQRTTSPALNIGLTSGDVCYVNMETGVGTNALHMRDANGVTYHTTK